MMIDYWSKLLPGTSPTPANDIEIKVTDLDLLNFGVKVFKNSLFLNSCMDLLYI